MIKLVYVWFALKIILCGCQSDQRRNGFKKARTDYKVSKIGRLPAIVDESSGLARNEKSGSFWTHNDSGGKPELYEVDKEGNLLSTRSVTEARNVDWEDLAQSSDGTLYIGDMGNNNNARRNLTIYTLPPDGSPTSTITFNYADQKDFPPAREKLNFDCEAFFYHNDYLYLFSKNRSKPAQTVKLYALPASPGNYTIAAQDSVLISTQVTSADINPSGTTFALLTYGKILLFGVSHGIINFKNPQDCIKIGKMQAEAIIFLNDNDLMITNEQQKMYLIRPK
jgi:hypothetical protein